jgi:hypothetical protein
MAKPIPGQQKLTDELKTLWARANVAQKREFADFCRRLAFQKIRNACESVSGVVPDRDRHPS